MQRLRSILAALMIVCGFALGALRLGLPLLGSHPEWFAGQLSTALESRVEIDAVAARFVGWSPEIALSGVRVFAENETDPVARFGRVDIKFGALLNAWRHRFAVSEVRLYGLRLTIERGLDGSLSLAHHAGESGRGGSGDSGGTGAATAHGNNAAASAPQRLGALLERNIRLRLIDADIVWHDQLKLKKPVTLERCQLLLRARAGGVSGRLRAPLPRGAGTTMQATLDLKGNPLTRDWSGRFTAAVADIALAPALDVLELTPQIPLDGRVGMLATLEVAQGNVVETRFELSLDGLAERVIDRVGSPAALPLSRLTVSGHGTRSGDLWQTRVSLSHARGGRIDGSLEVADLGSAFLPGRAHFSTREAELGWMTELSAILLRAARGDDDQTAALLNEMAPRGRVSRFDLTLDANAPTLSPRLALTLHDVTSRQQGALPGLNLQALMLDGDRDTLRITLPAQRITLEAPQHLVAPLDMDVAHVMVEIDRPLQHAPDLYLEEALLTLQGFPVRAAGNIQDLGPQAFASLGLSLGPGAMADAPALIPLGAMSEDGDAWIRRALVGGRILGGQMLLRGPLAEFPFTPEEGRFRAAVTARDAIVDYSPDWPRVEDAALTLDFDATRLAVNVDEGRLMRAWLGPSTFEIPDLDAQDYVLNIDGDVRTSWEALTDFVSASPLADGGARDLRKLAVADEVNIELKLSVPLETDDDTAIDGALEFPGNAFVYREFDLALGALTGRIDFNRDDWGGSGLTATLAGEPVRVDVSGGRVAQPYDVSLTVTGRSELDFLSAQFAAFAPETQALVNGPGRLDALRGQVDWRLGLLLPVGDEAPEGTPIRLTFNADLGPAVAQLPWPFNELGEGEGNGTLDVLAWLEGETEANSHVRLGEEFGFYFREDTLGISAVTLDFGPHQPPTPTLGKLRLQGRLDRLPVDGLLSLIPEETDTGHPLDLTGRLSVGELALGGQRFSGVELTIDQQGPNTELSAQSTSLFGRVLFTEPENDIPRLRVDLERLAVSSPATQTDVAPEASERALSSPLSVGGTDTAPGTGPSLPTSGASPERTAAGGTGGPAPLTETLDPRTLPAIEVDIGALRLNGADLGRLVLKAEPTERGLAVNKLALTHPAFSISGDGVWQRTAQHEQSLFKLTAETTTLSAMLEGFGYNSEAIRGAPSTFELDANWAGSPADFSLANVEGALDLALGKGALLDIKPGGGRLFGLLSIQTLPRRLSLDFNDLFGKGLAFDSIEGHFEIAAGEAYTNNLTLTGPSVQINIAGRTGLATRDYDQRVTVTPQLASNLPVAGAFFGPLGVGVGAAIYLGGKLFKALPDQVDRILQQKYTVTGPWEDPQVNPE